MSEPAPPVARARATQPQPASPLAELNQYIRDRRAALLAASGGADGSDRDELASARRFRHAWSRSQVLDEVEDALARKPVHAGPLNSHALVLQSLALMKELSPDYLRHFLQHVETLQWLEDAGARQPREPVKASRRPRSARASKGR